MEWCYIATPNMKVEKKEPTSFILKKLKKAVLILVKATCFPHKTQILRTALFFINLFSSRECVKQRRKLLPCQLFHFWNGKEGSFKFTMVHWRKYIANGLESKEYTPPIAKGTRNFFFQYPIFIIEQKVTAGYKGKENIYKLVPIDFLNYVFDVM